MRVAPARKGGRKPGPLRVAIADASQLIYSDDYRNGWVWGFKSIGCEVQVFDIAHMSKIRMDVRSPYSTGRLGSFAKMSAENFLRFKPDLVFCHHGRAASAHQFLEVFRKHSIPTAVYLCDEPYEVGETASYSPAFDFVFTMDPATLHIHREARGGKDGHVFYLPPGVNTDHFKPGLPYPKRTTPVFFLGNATLTPRPRYFRPIERLVDGADIRFWSTVGKGHAKWVDLKDHPKLYGGCRVALNVHRDPAITEECHVKRVRSRSRHKPVPRGMKLCTVPPRQWGTGFWNDCNAPAAHVNPRFFEMGACGTLVVSDDSRSELAELFPFMPRAQDSDHFIELVLHYLKHESEAHKLGDACRYLISNRHTYRHRAAEVLIRVGLKASCADDLVSSLGAPGDWLSRQDFDQHGARSPSEPTGSSERWSPQYGMSLISQSGNLRDPDSLDMKSAL